MLQRRTDLALEAREIWESGKKKADRLHGVESRQSEREGYPVTTVEITSQEGAQALGKPVGSDSENEKNTYVSLLGLEEARRLAARRTDEALTALEMFGDDAASLRQLAQALLTRDH